MPPVLENRTLGGCPLEDSGIASNSIAGIQSARLLLGRSCQGKIFVPSPKLQQLEEPITPSLELVRGSFEWHTEIIDPIRGSHPRIPDLAGTHMVDPVKLGEDHDDAGEWGVGEFVF